MPAASPEQHAHQDTSLLRHSSDAGVQQQAVHVQQCRQPAEGAVTQAATAEGSTTKGSRASQKEQQLQQQQQPDGVQQHSPGSRQSAVHSLNRRHHYAGSTPGSVGLSGYSTSPSSQQASNSMKGHSRHAGPSARPAALFVTQCAEAGSSIKHGAKPARHDSALGHPVPSQKLPDQSGASMSSTGRSASESRVPQGKERPGLPNLSECVKGDAWADEGTTSTATGISSSSSSSTLDQKCLGAASSMHQTALQSMMVPLELPSPMPDRRSEGTALPIRSSAGVQAWALLVLEGEYACSLLSGCVAIDHHWRLLLY